MSYYISVHLGSILSIVAFKHIEPESGAVTGYSKIATRSLFLCDGSPPKWLNQLRPHFLIMYSVVPQNDSSLKRPDFSTHFC